MDNPTIHQAKVIRIIDETPIVKRFFLQMPQSAEFQFEAGQFIALNIGEGESTIRRYYSVASAPYSDGTFELCISFKPGGAGSSALWEQITEGASIGVDGPYGKFTLPESLPNELCFIATGTGIAPLRSMIHHIFNSGKHTGPITLISGNRSEIDNLYATEFEKLQSEQPDFKFIPTLSRPSPSWKGKTGYVHEVYKREFADHRPCMFFLCGWHDMLKESRNTLEAMGYAKDMIRFESYG